MVLSANIRALYIQAVIVNYVRNLGLLVTYRCRSAVRGKVSPNDQKY